MLWKLHKESKTEAELGWRQRLSGKPRFSGTRTPVRDEISYLTPLLETLGQYRRKANSREE
jgi:hypothetical protein